MFTPVCTVLITAVAAVAVHQEELHLAGAGAAAVIAGLYVVLWGKADDMKQPATGTKPCSSDSRRDDVAAEPLLGDDSRRAFGSARHGSTGFNSRTETAMGKNARERCVPLSQYTSHCHSRSPSALPFQTCAIERMSATFRW
uniref:WAT1-related protein n=1 Tax=Oryza punctata TaxID=4537 RepID=A0A0E0M1F0_ORYPU